MSDNDNTSVLSLQALVIVVKWMNDLRRREAIISKIMAKGKNDMRKELCPHYYFPSPSLQAKYSAMFHKEHSG